MDEPTRLSVWIVRTTCFNEAAAAAAIDDLETRRLARAIGAACLSPRSEPIAGAKRTPNVCRRHGGAAVAKLGRQPGAKETQKSHIC